MMNGTTKSHIYPTQYIIVTIFPHLHYKSYLWYFRVSPWYCHTKFIYEMNNLWGSSNVLVFKIETLSLDQKQFCFI